MWGYPRGYAELAITVITCWHLRDVHEDGGYPWLYIRATYDGRKEKLACLLDLVLQLVVMLNSFTLPESCPAPTVANSFTPGEESALVLWDALKHLPSPYPTELSVNLSLLLG